MTVHNALPHAIATIFAASLSVVAAIAATALDPVGVFIAGLIAFVCVNWGPKILK